MKYFEHFKIGGLSILLLIFIALEANYLSPQLFQGMPVGGQIEAINPREGDGKVGKAQWSDMTLGIKFVTNTTDYEVERNKVLLEVQKLGTSSTVDAGAMADWEEIKTYEECVMATTSQFKLPDDYFKLQRAGADAIKNNQCINS